MQYPPDNQVPFQQQPNTQYPPQQPWQQQPGQWQQPQYQPPPNYYPPQQPPMYQPPPQRPKKKSKIGLIVALVAGVIILACIGSFALASKSANQSSKTAVAVTATSIPTDTPTNAPIATAAPNPHFKVGETASTADGYIITINKTYTSSGTEFDTPSKGNQYFVIDVSVKNITGQVQHMASNQFTLTDSSGQTIDDTIASSLPNVHPYIGGTLQDGATMRGQIVYEVPTGKHPYNMSFAGNIFGDIQTFWDLTT